MKHLIFFCSLVLSAWCSAQETDYPRHPKPRINVGWSITDYAMNTFGLEGMYRFNRNAVIVGYGNVYGNYDTDQESFQSSNQLITGNVFKLNHKFYISGEEWLFFSIVHGPILQYYQLPFYVDEWVSFQEDGLTLYRLAAVEKAYTANRWGYDFRINLEYTESFFSMDVGFGLGYRELTSSEEIPENYSIDSQFDGIAYEGIRPSLQLKIGFYLDAFSTTSARQK
jgi:hypothetical protein